MIPPKVAEAAKAALPRLVTTPLDGPPIVGSIVVVNSPAKDVRRLALVTRIDTDSLWCHLLSNEIEWATDLDVVLRSDVTGLPYALLAMGELYFDIKPEQVHRVLAWVAVEIADRVHDALYDDHVGGLECGTPLSGRGDPRRAFKERELDVLRKLRLVWEEAT